MDNDMTINVFGREMYSWWSDYCMLCGSKNYLRLDSDLAMGFECFSCGSNNWIDELSCSSFCMLHGYTEEEAEECLRMGKFPLVLIGGQMSPDLEY